MFRGKVAWFSNAKGYGFIERADARPGMADVFVHITEIQRSGLSHLFGGQDVSFDLGMTRQGRSCATNVKVREPATV